MKRKTFTTFKKSTRDKLEALYNAGVPVKQIAAQLGYSFQSIYKELKRGYYLHRNYDWTETRKYSADKAQRSADIRSTGKGAPLKIGNDMKFAKYVEDMILKGYSPAAILGEIEDNNIEFQTKVCRVTLYSYIDKGVFLRVSNKNLLRKGKKKPKRKKVQYQKKLPDLMHSIEQRPSEVKQRSTFGHWELDSIIGRKEKGETVLVMTERLTRMELIFKSKDKTAYSTVKMLNSLEKSVGSESFKKVFRSITCDNGTEFSDTNGMEYSPFTGEQRTNVYYCHAYCSSERGSNENQNAFIRRFIPKGTLIKKYTHKRIKEIQDFINSYPRALFKWSNSLKMFIKELEKLNLKNFYSKIRFIT